MCLYNDIVGYSSAFVSFFKNKLLYLHQNLRLYITILAFLMQFNDA